MSEIRIKSALISVFDKGGLEEIVPLLKQNEITVYSTGGTYTHLESLGLNPVKVEDVTGYPSILDGRVKTLHPKVFGGILARREDDHMSQLDKYEIPPIDLVVVDLYPFEDTVRNTTDESKIIEKIDIGGISLIRAAAKNFKDVLIIPSKDQYSFLRDVLSGGATTNVSERQQMAAEAFNISSHYDTAIFNYFNTQVDESIAGLKLSSGQATTLRYGENPHQEAQF